MEINYPVIVKSVLADLPSRRKEIVERRFGLKNGNEGETLQAIGDDLNITRERVRQIVNDTLSYLLEKKGDSLKAPIDSLNDYFQKNGGVKKEENIFKDIASVVFNGPVYFFLSIAPDFARHNETEEYHDFWATRNGSVKKAEKTVQAVIERLEQEKKPIDFGDLRKANPYHLSQQPLISYIEISKIIAQSLEGLFGLVSWPEINPRGIKDRAYIVLKNAQEPLHFMEITKKINELPINKGPVIPESVHNELIRSQFFVLVGRGMYALKEWGYEPGTVKEIVIKILKEAKKPITRRELIEKTLGQRKVKENTIILSLQDKTQFIKTPDGKISLKK